MLSRLQILFTFFVLFSFQVSVSASTPNLNLSDNTLSSKLNQEVVKLFYSNGQIQIIGLTGTGNITIYSIIGNKIAQFPNVRLADFKNSIVLESGSMYIVRIEFNSTVKTYKLIAN